MRLAAAFVLLAAPAAAQVLDDTPRIAVMSAFEPEWLALQDMMDAPEEHRVNGTRFLLGEIGGQPVVLFLSGVSMVNAAMTTQLALDRFAVEGIVFSGIAGGVDPSLSIGDVVVADRWSQYLESVFARETADGYALPPWMSPGEMAPFGMIHPQPVGVAREGAEGVEPVTWFPVDPGYLDVAREVAAGLDLAACTAENVCLSDPPEVVVGGNGVSGQAFVDNAAVREWTFDTFGAQVLDMESAAVAHVAYANGVPFIAFRSLSDLAGGGEGANEMGTFMSLASRNSAAVVEAFLAALP
jgi:adenosylhomocysteine nucleosidase